MKPAHLIVFVIWGALCSSLLVYAAMLSSITFVPGKADASTLSNVIALAAGSAAATRAGQSRFLLAPKDEIGRASCRERV